MASSRRTSILSYVDLFTPHHIALLADWLEEKGHLCVEIYIPHGGGSGSYHTVRSLKELKSVITDLRSQEVQITVWKNHTQAEFESEEYKPIADELRWIYSHTDEVMYFSVQKNRNWSECYDKNPSKYKKDLEEWSS